jgi:formate hydrogenlyase subunit 4
MTGDLLTIVYLIAFGTFFLALAGLDIGGAFGGFGSSREMTISALAEGGLIFSLLAVAINVGTSNLFEMSTLGFSFYDQHLLPTLLALAGFFVVLLAEAARFPFDNPATHLELTMVHEAMILEYSGKRLALMEWSAANKLICFIAIGANIFFPWGLATSVGVSVLILSLIIFILKIFIFCAVIALIESSMAKFRFFRLPDLLFISFILSVMAISLTQIL